jgi:hypothetical protein
VAGCAIVRLVSRDATQRLTILHVRSPLARHCTSLPHPTTLDRAFSQPCSRLHRH